MTEKEQIICDFTTGICGPAGEQTTASQGFVDLSTLQGEELQEDTKNREEAEE